MMSALAVSLRQAGTQPTGTMTAQACIESCWRSHVMCLETERYGLEQGGAHVRPAHLMLLADCAEMCEEQTPPPVMPGMAGQASPAAGERIEGRLAFLRTELAITDAQTAAWSSFADSLRAGSRHLAQARDALRAAGPGQAGAEERLASYERHLAARIASIRVTRTSFSTLYAALDEGQKHTADELLVPYLETF